MTNLSPEAGLGVDPERAPDEFEQTRPKTLMELERKRLLLRSETTPEALACDEEELARVYQLLNDSSRTGVFHSVTLRLWTEDYGLTDEGQPVFDHAMNPMSVVKFHLHEPERESRAAASFLRRKKTTDIQPMHDYFICEPDCSNSTADESARLLLRRVPSSGGWAEQYDQSESAWIKDSTGFFKPGPRIVQFGRAI